MHRGMNHLLLENESPLGKPYWKWKFSSLPPNFSNSSDLQVLSISMSLRRFLQILERT